MEHHESVAEQKCKKETREKSILQRKWVSDPSPEIRLFSDLDGKSHTELEGPQVGVSVSNSTGLGQKHHPGKFLSSTVSQSSQNSQYPQVTPHPYSQRLPHSYPQQLMQDSVLPGTEPQSGPEPHTWHRKCPPSDDMFLEHTHSHGVFPQQKPPSSPVVFVQYSQPGSEQYEEIHKKELKPKKPGKYICNYCGRACAKPSVLKKHIRSHTGERPYPCGPCGFSFKTKSNLYKHRKSHAHAIKAGLVPFSEQAATRADLDQASSVGEADIHSDGEQSTDTEEETTEGLLYQDTNCQIPQLSFESESSTAEKIGQPAYADSAEESSVASMKVPILIIPKPGIPSTAMEYTNSQVGQGDESHAIKQRLALRLTEKKGQDSEQSLNLLSPHSKGSTDSGYFSRSESAEQQISPPNTNAKSYEEIMFGRTWYYKPSSRLRQPIPIGMTVGQDSNVISMNESDVILEVGMRSLEHRFLTGDSSEMQMLSRSDVYSPDPHHNSSLLEAPSDSGPLLRSNSMPTSSLTNLNVPPGLRVSHSFDEMMTPDDVFYPGAAGLRRLRRQAAFEHSVHEGHNDSENCSILAKNPVPPLKFRDRDHLAKDFRSLGKEGVGPETERTHFVPHSYKVSMVESGNRKRRKEKSVGDEEDSVGHYDSSKSGCVEIVGDYDPNMCQDVSRVTSTGIGAICSSHSQSDSLDNGTGINSEDLVVIPDLDRKTTGNVISVIQHTNSLSRPSSFEKADSVDLPSYQDKPTRKLSEHSDTDNVEVSKSPELVLRSESMERQQPNDSELAGLSPNQQYHMPHKLVRQPNIQVPEIRVTEEPDKPERELEAAAKEPEKQHVEEFQWPQRSETLSQLPAEKLPPKKKRLRLADMEYSSGESSFESTCTSLSRSPSQDSNLSHSSSFSMSFEKEESMKPMSPTKLDDLCKQSEFLTVPGSGHSLSIPGHHHREMRRSSSEQAPCTLPAEAPEIRSKSFDYGSLSTSSRQGELYASPSSSKDVRRRGYLVRQASLSVYPETVLQEQSADISMKQEHSEIASHLSNLGWHSGSLTTSHGTITGEDRKSKRTQGLSVDCGHSTKELINQEALHHSSSLAFQYWDNTLTQKQQHYLSYSKHHLPKIRNRHPSLLPICQQLPQALHQEQCDSETDRGCSQSHYLPHLHSHSSQTPSISSSTLQYTQTVSSSFPGMSVPVRIQTHMPSYSSVMYTSMSESLGTHAQCVTSRVKSSEKALPISLTGMTSKHETGLHLSHVFGNPDVSVQYPILKIAESLPGRLNTGIPLSMTSRTISTTDASSGIGASKRMLSPASSLELFIETKQQKRVKEERMYGQIVKELSAVELSNTGANKSNRKPPDHSMTDATEQDKVTLPPTSNFPVTKGPAHLTAILPAVEGLTPSLPILPDTQNRTQSTEQLDVDESAPEARCCQKTMFFSSDAHGESKQDMGNKIPVNMLIQLANQVGGGPGCTFLLTDLADAQQFFQFPTLRTKTSVSWCFLNYTKPNHSQTTPLNSVYGSWCVSSYNPNPFSLSTKATLALFCSKQRKNTETYTTAAMDQLGSGKLVSSLLWKQRFDQLKPEVTQLDLGKYSHQKKSLGTRESGNDDRSEKEPLISKQAEPTRIKIFEGGYKSNEDYVYVRGRGRGKYICEECGIRCKKPSMLKKHIRTHTDVRPYVCKFCNFAFKTKGNLTKHMKSKAHMKKCLELGVSVTCVDDVEAEEADITEENPRDSRKFGMADHQFSDADDSEGPEDDGDEIDEDEEDEEEYDFDSTPKTCSRSTSPQPHSLALLAATVVTASQGSSADFLRSASKPPLFSYLTSLPSIQVTQLVNCEPMGDAAHSQERQNVLPGTLTENYRNQLSVPSSMDEDSSLSPEHISPASDLSPSCLSSPGCDSSPLREPSPTSQRYLSPRGDLSPRRRLSPRREAYHLRHLSPRRDIFHRDVSPRGDHSPTNLLLPISNMGRPTSPGRELSSRRDLSPRSRYRVRPVSPRRGLHHHSSSWNLGQNLQAELTSLAQKTRSTSETETEQMKKLDFGRNNNNTGTATSHHGLFSHLPLHSQQQIHSPFPMIPIGGIQIVHSVRPSIHTHPAHLPLQKSTSEESNANEVFIQVADGKMPSGGYHVDSPQTHGNILFSPKGEESLPSAAMLSAKSERDTNEIADKDIKQEESIQTCTKAIASLRIASEDPLEKSLSTDSPPYQQSPTPSHSPLNPQKMASIKIHPSSELDSRQPLNSSAIPPHSSTENVLSYLPLNSKSDEAKQPLLQSQEEWSLNAKRLNNCTENG